MRNQNKYSFIHLNLIFQTFFTTWTALVRAYLVTHFYEAKTAWSQQNIYLGQRTGLGPENKSRNKQPILLKEKYKPNGLSVMGVKTELNIFITDLSNRLARDGAIFINGTRHFYQENIK